LGTKPIQFCLCYLESLLNKVNYLSELSKTIEFFLVGSILLIDLS
jgi:hypothetical protein